MIVKGPITEKSEEARACLPEISTGLPDSLSNFKTDVQWYKFFRMYDLIVRIIYRV